MRFLFQRTRITTPVWRPFMNHFGKSFTVPACAMATAAFLSACGGGDAGAPLSNAASFGYAVDGYLKDAAVKCDASGIVVKTDSAGFFRFPDGCSSTMTLTGGTNVDTSLPFTGTLKAPTGSKMVTPLTTLLVGGMTQDQVNTSLGLPAGTDLTNTDPALTSAGTLVNPELLKKTLALQQLLLQTTEALSGVAGDAAATTKQAIFSDVASAFATGLMGSAKLNSDSVTVNLAVVKDLVAAAATKVGTSSTVPSAAKIAVAGINPATLAAVIAGGMKAQADAMLGATDVTAAALAVKTKTLQSDMTIQNAVAGATATLTKAPTDASVIAAANQLTDAVKAAISPETVATGPTTAPGTTIPAGAVTIYSEAASAAGFNPFPNWGQATQFSEATVANNKSLKYTSLNYEGIEFNAVDVSTKSKLHLDVWSPDLTSVKVSIISAGKENAYTQTLKTGLWNSVDIDLSNYTVPDKTAIIQIKLESTGSGTMYVDNIYFDGTSGDGAVSCGDTAPTCAPTTTIPAESAIVYSDASTIAGIDTAPVWGQSPPVVASEQTIASNKSLKYTFGALYQGIDWSGTPQDVSSKGTLHLDVWTADVASIKVSLIGGGAENGVSKTLTAGTWTRLDIPLSQYTSPDLTKIIQMKLEPSAAGTIYVDNIYFDGMATTGDSGNSVFTGGIFASDYSGNLGANTARSDKGGNVGFFLDPRLFANKAFDDGSVCGSACNPGGVFNFYYGIGKLTPILTDAYFGAYVNAPGNGTADASAFSKVKLKFWGDAESWEKPNFTAQVDVILQGPVNAACSNGSGRPEIIRTVAAQKIGAGSDYTIPKVDFTLAESCGGTYTSNSVWSAVGAVVVRLAGTNLQYVNTVPSTPESFPTFINIGPISFIN